MNRPDPRYAPWRDRKPPQMSGLAFVNGVILLGVPIAAMLWIGILKLCGVL